MICLEGGFGRGVARIPCPVGQRSTFDVQKCVISHRGGIGDLRSLIIVARKEMRSGGVVPRIVTFEYLACSKVRNLGCVLVCG